MCYIEFIKDSYRNGENITNEIIIFSYACSEYDDPEKWYDKYDRFFMNTIIIMAPYTYPLLEKIKRFHNDHELEQEIIPDKYFNKYFHIDILLKQICRQKFTMDLFENIKSYVGDVMSYQTYSFFYFDGFYNSQDKKNEFLIMQLKKFATMHFAEEYGKYIFRWRKKPSINIIKKKPKKKRKNKKPSIVVMKDCEW